MTPRFRRNTARVVGVALIGLALVLFAGGGTASADEAPPAPAASGWWWQAQQLPTALPPPPNVKPGQLHIEGGPSDSKGSAFAALRYTLSASQTTQQLTLTVAEATGTPVLLACKTAATWAPAEAGAWSAAPQVDTKACANGTAGADGTTWTFPTSALQAGTVLDIAIVPGVDPTTHAPAPFSLTADKPAAGALTLSGASGATSTAPTSGSSPSFSPGASPSAVPSSGGGSAVRPAAPTPAPTGLPSDKVSTPASTSPQAGGVNPALAAAELPARDKRAGFVVLGIAALVALYAWRQDNLIAMNGGTLPGMATQDVGLGRFAQPRTGTPPALT